jgi:hypothetical protein
MKTVIKPLLITFVLTFFYSCATLSVSTDYDKTADFSKYKTFSFYNLNVTGIGINELDQKRIVKAIKENLIKKGFTEVTDNPDIKINATTILKVEQQYNANSNYYGAGGVYRPYRWGGGYGMSSTTVTVQNYINGSLIIDVLDGASDSLVWTGTGNKDITEKQDNQDQVIADVVDQIMQSFPPKTAKK